MSGVAPGRPTIKPRTSFSASSTLKSFAGSYELYRKEQNNRDNQVVNKKDSDYYEDFYNTQDTVEHPSLVAVNTTFAVPQTSSSPTSTLPPPPSTTSPLKTTSYVSDEYYDDYYDYDYDVEKDSMQSSTRITTTTPQSTTSQDSFKVSQGEIAKVYIICILLVYWCADFTSARAVVSYLFCSISRFAHFGTFHSSPLNSYR